MLVATGSLGDLGIMPGHAPLLTELAPGPIRLVGVDGVSGGEQEITFFLSGGFLEVQPDRINVLADSALRAEQLAEEVLEKARQQAVAQMKQGEKDAEFNYSLAAIHLAETVAKLRTIRQIKSRLNIK